MWELRSSISAKSTALPDRKASNVLVQTAEKPGKAFKGIDGKQVMGCNWIAGKAR